MLKFLKKTVIFLLYAQVAYGAGESSENEDALSSLEIIAKSPFLYNVPYVEPSDPKDFKDFKEREKRFINLFKKGKYLDRGESILWYYYESGKVHSPTYQLSQLIADNQLEKSGKTIFEKSVNVPCKSGETLLYHLLKKEDKNKEDLYLVFDLLGMGFTNVNKRPPGKPTPLKLFMDIDVRKFDCVVRFEQRRRVRIGIRSNTMPLTASYIKNYGMELFRNKKLDKEGWKCLIKYHFWDTVAIIFFLIIGSIMLFFWADYVFNLKKVLSQDLRRKKTKKLNSGAKKVNHTPS